MSSVTRAAVQQATRYQYSRKRTEKSAMKKPPQ
jgi:hypothetical protein